MTEIQMFLFLLLQVTFNILLLLLLEARQRKLQSRLQTHQDMMMLALRSSRYSGLGKAKSNKIC